AELGRLQERERQLEAQVEAARVEVPTAPELDEETVAAMVGEETLHVLQTARESASQIKIRAEEAAAKILREANDEVNRVRREAEVEAARKRHDATSDAEAEVALAKQQGREMVNEARAYRERVLADLERRTKVARQQIDDLVHGRDRLMQVFERARLVAVDVTSELQSVDGPEEFVNLSPTTGPLPLMLPATDRPDDAVARPDDDVDDLDPVDVPVDEFTDGGDDEIAGVGSEGGDGALGEADAAGDPSDDLDDDDTVPIATAKPRDANVVSLFRDRPVDAGGGSSDDGDDEPDIDGPDGAGDATAVADRPDVNGIFERLRSETPTVDDADDSADGPVESADESVEVDGSVEAADDESPDDESPDEPAMAEPTPFTRRDEALVPLIVSGARKLKRVLADEQNGALDLLRQNKPVTQIGDLVPAIDDHVRTYADALDDELVDAAVVGAGEAGKNDTRSLRTTIRKGALTSAHEMMRDNLVMPLRARLERAVADGAGDNEDITKRVRAVYREWKTQHIDHQLDDVFRFAHGGGVVTGIKPGTHVAWMIDPSEPTCADCEDNSLAGSVEVGSEFPTGHAAAPAHAGCRCLTVPSAQ
ncbi:MAG: hypothetical protein ABIP17_13295, partial [Ilumatobacteraceae bacterium]